MGEREEWTGGSVDCGVVGDGKDVGEVGEEVEVV